MCSYFFLWEGIWCNPSLYGEWMSLWPSFMHMVFAVAEIGVHSSVPDFGGFVFQWKNLSTPQVYTSDAWWELKCVQGCFCFLKDVCIYVMGLHVYSPVTFAGLCFYCMWIIYKRSQSVQKYMHCAWWVSAMCVGMYLEGLWWKKNPEDVNLWIDFVFCARREFPRALKV